MGLLIRDVLLCLFPLDSGFCVDYSPKTPQCLSKLLGFCKVRSDNASDFRGIEIGDQQTTSLTDLQFKQLNQLIVVNL